jgi:4-amino-4-deoxy-L-arabinose transferase-like glycosyltransferase
VIGDTRQAWIRNLPVLGVIWLLGAIGDRLWFALDRSVPAWDQADYLSGALNYWKALQTPDWFSSAWWVDLWQLSSKIPPLVYLLTVPLLNIFEPGADQSTLVNLLFNAVLLVSVYSIGTYLFTVPVGLLAAGFCMLMPGLYRLRLEYMIDYPLAAMVMLSFLCLTLWRGEKREGRREKGEGRREKGEGRREKGEGRREKGEGRREKAEGGEEGETERQDLETGEQPLAQTGDDPAGSLESKQTQQIQEAELEPQEPQENPVAAIALQPSPEITLLTPEDQPQLESQTEQDEGHGLLSPPSLLSHSASPPLPPSFPPPLLPYLLSLLSWLRRIFPSLLPWLLAIATGISLGLALMTKQTALLFLLIPLLWVGMETLGQRDCGRLLQWLLAIGCSIPVFYPWYRTNWLLILTSSSRATVDSALAEGDPSLLSLNAWIYYLKTLPGLVSQPLLLVGLIGLFCFWRRSRVSSLWSGQKDYSPKPREYQQQMFAATQRSVVWLLVFWVGGYLLSTLNPNKDPRYVVPFLPVLAVILSYGLTLLPRSWRYFQWGVVGLAAVLMLASLFPLGNAALLGSTHLVYRGPGFPHREVVAEVIRAQPYLQSTLGVLPSTPQLNQHNINYFGLLQNYQVYGRQIGTRRSHVVQDGRSLSWYLSKTGDQGSIRNPEAQTSLGKQIEQTGEFVIQKSWQLPDNSNLNLYRRQLPLVDVQPVREEPENKGTEEQKIDNQETENQENEDLGNALKRYRRGNALAPITLLSPVTLEEISLPEQAPPGQSIPVTYQWVGTWDALRSGLVLLTWRRQQETPETRADRWFHDHGIGMGLLKASPTENPNLSQFQVVERTASLVPASLPAGTYTLDAVYLNRTSGETLPIATPAISLRITPDAAATPAPALDLMTQFRNLAATLPQGTKALDRIFDQIARINQYDPTQDYLNQTRQIMEYRLQQEPKNRIFAYTLALAQVLKRRVDPAIAALQQVTQLDPKNPYAYGYLAFANLYDFRPTAAQTAIDTALQLNPNLPELRGLKAIALLMQGKFQQAWQEGREVRF